MATHRLESGKLVDPSKAANSWEEARDWNGNNFISRATGSQWHHETLYQSRKGTWYIVASSQWQGSMDDARELSGKEAAEWLALNEHDLPKSLAQYADIVE